MTQSLHLDPIPPVPRGGLPRGPTFDIIERTRQRHILTLRNRMPNMIDIQSDPRSNEADLKPSQLNDSEAMHELIEGRILTSPFHKFQGRCQVSRRSVPYVEGGPAPADDYNDIWDVIIPGGVPDEVVVSQVALIGPDLFTELSPNGLRRVYTITHIAQDRLRYIARLTMEVYGLRRGP